MRMSEFHGPFRWTLVRRVSTSHKLMGFSVLILVHKPWTVNSMSLNLFLIYQRKNISFYQSVRLRRTRGFKWFVVITLWDRGFSSWQFIDDWFAFFVGNECSLYRCSGGLIRHHSRGGRFIVEVFLVVDDLRQTVSPLKIETSSAQMDTGVVPRFLRHWCKVPNTALPTSSFQSGRLQQVIKSVFLDVCDVGALTTGHRIADLMFCKMKRHRFSSLSESNGALEGRFRR